LLGGLRILYVEHGNPSCVPVVFLHGYSDSWRSWELLLPKLPASVHEFALTQRGHGDADRPAAATDPRTTPPTSPPSWTPSG
jgi:non-heme chloroperoxidase